MKTQPLKVGDTFRLQRADLDGLFKALKKKGFKIVGPTVRDAAIVYDELAGPGDLPAGLTEEQDAGSYRIKKRNDRALFGYTTGPHSWKKFLFPPKQLLWQARRKGKEFEISEEAKAPPRYAFIGVRSCELHAIAVQDKVFMGESFTDPVYSARRSKTFIVAVNCGQAGGTCFCVSMNTGPRAENGFDLALTEVIAGEDHYFVVEIGTEPGARVAAKIPHEKAGNKEQRIVDDIVSNTRAQMGRKMDTDGIQALLQSHPEHPRWKDVAERCLACANCTLVCPTCFCSTVEDVTDLTGDHAERWRTWDSCFTMDFTYMNHTPTRSSTQARYRHWMTHKLSTWFDQFGTSGCVGCGRCITWCPTGIDITEEVRAIRAASPPNSKEGT